MKAWSYSSLTSFETCARRFYFTKVSKEVVEPETEATRYGTEVHEALEFRVKEGRPLPPTMVKYEPFAARIANAKGATFCEMEIGLTKDFKETGFHDSDCWYRGIIDVGIDYGNVVALFDWKTGKVKNDHDQLKLFSVSYMITRPHVEISRSGYIWLAHNKVTRKDVRKDETGVIWAEFVGRVQRLEAAYDADRWPPKPSGLCRGWCPVGRNRCEFWYAKR